VRRLINITAVSVRYVRNGWGLRPPMQQARGGAIVVDTSGPDTQAGRVAETRLQRMRLAAFGLNAGLSRDIRLGNANDMPMPCHACPCK